MSNARAADGRIVLHPFAPSPSATAERVVARISGDAEVLTRLAEGLPNGIATPEAVAARLRRAGSHCEWGEPERFPGPTAFLRRARERGAASIELARADPSLLSDLQLGTYFDATWSRRLARRLPDARPLRGMPAGTRSLRALTLAADRAFWVGVRSHASRRERERLTKCSYVVVNYHRVAGDDKVGQERLDVSPVVFERQIAVLRRLGLRPVAAEELIAFHHDPDAVLPRRAFVLAADDGFRDAVLALSRHADLRPYLFVTTSAVGGTATWADGEPVASWDELAEIASRGAELGSHARVHVVLPELEADRLAEELTGSLADLREHLPCAHPLLAYPHGRADAQVRSAAAAAGYRLAFTTEPGRNGAGTEPLLLRRIGLKEWDGPPAVVWKALTGRLVPWRLERWRLRLNDVRRARRRALRTPRASDPS